MGTGEPANKGGFRTVQSSGTFFNTKGFQCKGVFKAGVLAADLGAGSAEATTLCDELATPHSPLKPILALVVILPLVALHLPCCLHQHHTNVRDSNESGKVLT